MKELFCRFIYFRAFAKVSYHILKKKAWSNNVAFLLIRYQCTTHLGQVEGAQVHKRLIDLMRSPDYVSQITSIAIDRSR